MTKVIKKHIKKAIIIYEDPDLKEGRRVIFGEPLELMGLIMTQFPILWKKIQVMVGKNLSPEEMIEVYKEMKEDWVKTHGLEVSNNMELELTYEVKKL